MLPPVARTVLTAAPLDALIDAFDAAVRERSLVALVLSRASATGDDVAARVTIRRVVVGGAERLAFVHRHPTRDVTRHTSPVEARAAIGALLAAAPTPAYAHATLRTTAGEWQLRTSRRGRATLSRAAAPTPAAHRPDVAADAADAADDAGDAAHDRRKQRHVDIDAPWLRELGVVGAGGRVVPAMAAKLRQIDKFVEVFDAAWRRVLADASDVRVVDYGCGKGHLTFAVFDHLRRQGVRPRVTGVELREALVDEANRRAERLGFAGLDFVQGDLRTIRAEAMDVTIALHACDTATDQALALGVAAGARVLVASPCCHRELRPQLRWPAALAPLYRHGIHAGQEAEMLTDSLRVLALETAGYAAQAFEFVSPEHTAKNKMILATRRAPAADRGDDRAAKEASDALAALKAFWGIREQALERLLLSRERS